MHTERHLLRELVRLDLDTEALVTGVTDILDSLAVPLEDGAETGESTGLRRTADRLEAVLTAHGAVELIGRPGERAVPETHNVVEVSDIADSPTDTVVRVIERGIRYRGGLLRPASVIVSSGKGTQS